MDSSDKRKEKDGFWKQFRNWEAENHFYFVLIIGLFLVWMITPWLLNQIYGAELGEESAKIGDTFNWFSSLATFVATMLLVISISLQRKDLSKQSEQLSLQKKELERSAIALSAQVEVSSLTAQINTIPSLIDDAVDEIAFLTKKTRADIRCNNERNIQGMFDLLEEWEKNEREIVMEISYSPSMNSDQMEAGRKDRLKKLEINYEQAKVCVKQIAGLWKRRVMAYSRIVKIEEEPRRKANLMSNYIPKKGAD